MSLSELLKEELPQGRFWTHSRTLIEGCTKVSPGCASCWSEAGAYIHSRREGSGFSPDVFSGRHFSGKIIEHPERLEDIVPKSCRRKPRVWTYWNDIFHENGTDEFTDKLLANIALAPRDYHIICTKRPASAAEYLNDEADWWSVHLGDVAYTVYGDEAACRVSNAISGVLGEGYNVGWPMRNVIILITMENQEMADKRMMDAVKLAVMGWTVGILAEPLLGPIDLNLIGTVPKDIAPRYTLVGQHISWIITGPENGSGKRPFNPAWAFSLRDQAQAASVPFLYKANGGKIGKFGDGPYLETP